MENLSFQIKRFLQNKNTVTILGALLIILILYFGYNIRIRNAVNPVRVPYAKVTIQPRTKITEDMIGFVDVPPAMIKGRIINDEKNIVNRWSNYNTIIPFGSLFYQDSVVNLAELPDSSLVNIPAGYTAFNLPVDIDNTYGNSIFPDNYIDLYLKAFDEDGKIIFGKIVENIKVLAVKDKDGRHVFENTEESRTPRVIIFAVPEDIHLVLRKALYLSNIRDIAAELVPVPTTESYSSTPGSINLTSQHLKAFVEVNTGVVKPDELPDVDGE